jgi:hypothetical protein
MWHKYSSPSPLSMILILILILTLLLILILSVTLTLMQSQEVVSRYDTSTHTHAHFSHCSDDPSFARVGRTLLSVAFDFCPSIPRGLPVLTKRTLVSPKTQAAQARRLRRFSISISYYTTRARVKVT